MFVVIFICGNIFLRIAGKIAKIHLEPAQISCHTVVPSLWILISTILTATFFVALLGFLYSSDDLFSALLPSECLFPTGKYSLISYCISIKLHDSALGFSTEAECNVAEIAAISTPRFLLNHLCLGHLIRQAIVNMF